MKNKIAEAGRSMVEIIAVLAIMGVLSVGGIWAYSNLMKEKQLNDIINLLNMKVVLLNSALQQQNFTSEDQLNQFLEPHKTNVGSFVLTFTAEPDNKGFISKITREDGQSIKGKECHKIIDRMSQLKYASDIDFTLEDAEQDDGSIGNVTVHLNGKAIDVDAVCGS